jgi:hypothetical protein
MMSSKKEKQTDIRRYCPSSREAGSARFELINCFILASDGPEQKRHLVHEINVMDRGTDMTVKRGGIPVLNAPHVFGKNHLHGVSWSSSFWYRMTFRYRQRNEASAESVAEYHGQPSAEDLASKAAYSQAWHGVNYDHF